MRPCLAKLSRRAEWFDIGSGNYLFTYNISAPGAPIKPQVLDVPLNGKKEDVIVSPGVGQHPVGLGRISGGGVRSIRGAALDKIMVEVNGNTSPQTP